jgi:DNA-binding transcriptional ArsR family regulator
MMHPSETKRLRKRLQMQTAHHDVFHAVADPTRRQLLALLAEQERPVQALCVPFEMSRPAISKHLQVLADAGLVHTRRVGRETVYALDPTPLRHLRVWLVELERSAHVPGRALQPVTHGQKPRQDLVFGED